MNETRRSRLDVSWFLWAVVLTLGGLVLGAVVVLSGPLGSSCADPPSQQERTQLESFLQVHVGDARDLDWTVMDCDDKGLAFLNFTTSMTPVRVSEAFLVDPACSPSAKQDAAAYGDVTCRTDAGVVVLGTEPDTGTWTQGSLTPKPR